MSQLDDDNARLALTPREWATLKLWNAGKPIGGKVRGKVVLDLADDQRHAAAACALFGQSYGFTQDDVRRLRGAAAFRWEDDGFRKALLSIADRLDMLLPAPEAP